MVKTIVEFQQSGLGQCIALACVFMIPLFWSIYSSAFVGSKEKPLFGRLFIPSVVLAGVFASIDGPSVGKIIAGSIFWIMFMAFEFGFVAHLINDKE